MKSLKELYKVGIGPSSSHTIAPSKIAEFMRSKYPRATHFKVILFGSLALTGKGHGTDVAIKKILGENTEIIFDMETTDLPHVNTMDVIAYENDTELAYKRAYSLGGGAIQIEGEPVIDPPEVYSLNTFNEIKEYCQDNDMRICDYVYQTEPDIKEFLEEIWACMVQSIRRGLKAEGILPGGLNVQRKARHLYNQRHIDESPETRESRLVCSYAFAVAEENAGGGLIVTAPTCGACGVLPAVLFYQQRKHGIPDSIVINALATAGIIGNLIKTNASISGAECGCQAEIGSACCMASGALAEMFEMELDQIEYASEIAMEHHLGLTCDPVNGLVQIPCIERNAVAAMRSINALSLANFLTDTRKVSLDTIIKTMYETGRDLSSIYKETSKGGLAKNFSPCN